MRLVRPAFVLTAAALSACSDPAAETKPKPKTPELSTASPKPKAGVHPEDGEGHLVFKRPSGECYVQVPKERPPPADLMSGERWVEDKVVACPKEFDEPAFAAIEDGRYWLQDKTGKCSQGYAYGNPPPPPAEVPCPPSLAKPK